MTLQDWVDRYPGDPEALQDALVEEIERLRAALVNLLPPDLAWKESGVGRVTIDVRKDDLRAARAVIGHEQ